MAMNIINHLVLFIDPRKKELEGRRQRLRFENQLKTVDEVKTSITNMQVTFYTVQGLSSSLSAVTIICLKKIDLLI